MNHPTGMVVWVNGRIVAEDQPAVTATDHGLTVGDGVFESMRIVDGRPFMIDRHLARLATSAAGIALELPDQTWLRGGIADAIAAAGPGAGRLRVTVTSGPGPLGSTRGTSGPTTLVHVGPTTTWPPTAKVVTTPWPRNERSPLSGVKIISYAENALALALARELGADEALFANTQGNLCEGSGSNVFVVLDSVLHTPPLTAGCLPGVTRELVCEAVQVVEADLPFAVVHDCDELFITSSTREVHPVSHVDGRPVRACPGPVTAATAAAFRALAARLA
jgi:branched-chain amino acid aminotransferase